MGLSEVLPLVYHFYLSFFHFTISQIGGLEVKRNGMWRQEGPYLLYYLSSLYYYHFRDCVSLGIVLTYSEYQIGLSLKMGELHQPTFLGY